MKIMVGMGSIDEYKEYVDAGADELYAGYVPESWNLSWGRTQALNRREVRYVNVQLGSESELEILRDMIRVKGFPVAIAVNAPAYNRDQVDELFPYIKRCCSLGFDRFIIGDAALLIYLEMKRVQGEISQPLHLHISGELGETNHRFLGIFRTMGAERVIFHRKMSLADMRECIRRDRENFPDQPMEYEAFVLNEMCHFHGGFCYTLHCDEFCHMCWVPYRLGDLHETEERRDRETKSKRTVPCGKPSIPIAEAMESDYEGLGESGCGFCALWQLREMGITHLKLVSRGNHVENTLADLKALKRALEILGESGSEQEYLRRMKEELFPGGCSHMCYYPEVGRQ